MKAPRSAVFDQTPCDKCCGYMEQGVILISVSDDAEEGSKNPYRTGGWCVVRDEAIHRMLDESAADAITARRMAFVPDAAWDMIGLPRGNSEAPATEADHG